MIDRLTFVRQLRDLVEQLDEALITVETATALNANDTATIKQRDLFRAERALEAAAAFLYELRLEEEARPPWARP